jgi:hypothetical protein
MVFNQRGIGRGDIVPLLRRGDSVFNYRILDWGRYGGDDHVVSPKWYDLEFAGVDKEITVATDA